MNIQLTTYGKEQYWVAAKTTLISSIEKGHSSLFYIQFRLTCSVDLETHFLAFNSYLYLLQMNIQ